MKFKKVLAMVLASALVFTGVNVSGLSGLEEVFAATSSVNDASGLLKIQYTGTGKIAEDGNNDHIVYANSLKDALAAMSADGVYSKKATITLKELEKGKGYTQTADNEDVDIANDENITLNLNGGSIGNGTNAGINVKCGSLTILNAEGHGSDNQIKAITVGQKADQEHVKSLGANGTIYDDKIASVGNVSVENTRIGTITEQRGNVSVSNSTFVENVTFNNDENGTAKTSTFSMEDSTLSTIEENNNSKDAGVLKSLNIKSGFLGFDPTKPLVCYNGAENTPFVSSGQVVDFTDGKVNLNVAGTNHDYAVSNASANKYIGMIVGAKGTVLPAVDANNRGQGVITAVLGDVELTGVPGNVRVVEQHGAKDGNAVTKDSNELKTSIKVSTLDNVSNVKIEETINYTYHEDAKDKTATGVVDKYVTGAVATYVDANDKKQKIYPIKAAVEDIGDVDSAIYKPTELDIAVGKPIVDESDRHWALTLDAKSDFINQDLPGEQPDTNAFIDRTGLNSVNSEGKAIDRSENVVTAANGRVAVPYRDIYFTNDPKERTTSSVALVKVDDARYYLGEARIKCAVTSAQKVEVLRTTDGEGLVFGEKYQPISKDLELVLEKKYTALKTTTVFTNKQGVQETFYTYEISDKTFNQVTGLTDGNRTNMIYQAYTVNGNINAINVVDPRLSFSKAFTLGTDSVEDGWNNNQKKFEGQTQTIIQTGTYGFTAQEEVTFKDIASFVVPADVAMAHTNGYWYIGEDTIKLAVGDQEYMDNLKQAAVAAGKNVGTVYPITSGFVFTDQGAYILKNVKATYNTSTKRYTGVEIFKGNETDVINDLPVYKIATQTTEIPQVVGRDWYVNKTAEYEAAKTDDTQEKKASFSEAELLQEIQKAVAQATTTAVTTAINSGEVVKTEKAEQDKAAAVEAAKAEAETAKTEAVNAAKAEAETAKTEAVNAAKAEAETAKTEAVNAAKAAAATAQEAAVAAAKTQAAKEKAAAVAAAKKSASVKKGQQVVYKKNIYKVTNVSKKTLAFVGTMSTGKTISIAKTVKVNGVKYKVTEIAKKALNGNKTAKKVVIANSVKKIGKKAFAGMNKNVTFKASAKLKKLAKKAQ